MKLRYQFLFDDVPFPWQGEGYEHPGLCVRIFRDLRSATVVAEDLTEAQWKLGECYGQIFTDLPSSVKRLDVSMPLYDGPLAEHYSSVQTTL